MNRILSILLVFANTIVISKTTLAGDYVTKTGYSDRDQGYARIQNWGNNSQDLLRDSGYVRYKAYHGTMGTQIIPLSWFAALETDDGQLVSSKEVYESFGFIKSDAPTQYNPYDLPIGFAISNDPKAVSKFGESKWLGLNCAGCHTTKMSINGKDVIVDGNATMFRLNQFEFAVKDIIKKTIQDNKRFYRFSQRVQPGPQYMNADIAEDSDTKTWKQLNKQVRRVRRAKLRNALKKFLDGFEKFLANNHTRPDGTHVMFSPGSVDALTLGGNMAAGCNKAMWEDPGIESINLLAPFISRNDFYEKGNCQAADVPVNIPHIWGTNNFSGGHYASEETNVTGRNFGAAMTGFGANRLEVKPKVILDLAIGDDQKFLSIDRDNLLYPETTIKLSDLDANQKWFDTLKAPTWQGLVEAGVVDPMSDEEITQANLGKDLYNAKCSSCHGAYVGQVGEGGYLTPVSVTNPNKHGAQFWDLVRVPTDQKVEGSEETINVIGTDLARNRRDGIESNKTLPKTLVPKFNELFAGDPNFEQIDEDGDRTVAARFYRQFWVLATLRNQVQLEPKQTQNYGAQEAREMLFGCRDIDELRKEIIVADAYKARPLDGIAFTGPYLHNGSVPTLWDLFSTSKKENAHGAKRPDSFDVGCLNYDIEKMGFVCDKSSSDPILSKGADSFDITRFGQSNVGHEDDSKLDPKVYGATASFGADLSDEQKTQLISFLKTLESMEDPSRGTCELYTYPSQDL